MAAAPAVLDRQPLDRQPLGRDPRGRAPVRPVSVAASGGSGGGVYLRRRVVAVAVLLLIVTLLTVAIGRIGAQAELADPVAGHAVVAPGETLWDVAAATAPQGVDTREQLGALRQLNGIDGSVVEAWTVVLIPAR